MFANIINFLLYISLFRRPAFDKFALVGDTTMLAHERVVQVAVALSVGLLVDLLLLDMDSFTGLYKSRPGSADGVKAALP